jgi:hypothetical protein
MFIIPDMAELPSFQDTRRLPSTRHSKKFRIPISWLVAAPEMIEIHRQDDKEVMQVIGIDWTRMMQDGVDIKPSGRRAI